MGATLSPLNFIITSGGTREPIDEVRFIGNISTGRLGACIAQVCHARGHRVCLLHGPQSVLPTCREEIDLQGFTTSGELKELLRSRVLRAVPPAVLVHAAAISDFIPALVSGKISSDREELILRLKRAEKIVDLIKTWNPEICLVKFKLESHCTREDLIRIGMESGRHSNADWVVANDTQSVIKGDHEALIMRRDGRLREARGKEGIASSLIDEVERDLETSRRSKRT